jgi:predicted transcriptional regulator
LPSVLKSANNKSGNRHSLDIVRDMLLIASVRVKKTRMMYQANMSYYQVKKYLQNLLEKNMLEYDGTSYYLITKKGLEFLRLYSKYVERKTKLEEQKKQSLKKRRLLEQMCFGRKCDHFIVGVKDHVHARNHVSSEI